MSREEQPPEHVDGKLSPDLSADETASSGSSDLSAALVEAELAEIATPEVVPMAELVADHALGKRPDVTGKDTFVPPIADNLDNISANGGAVAAIVLGVWSLVGAFITNWSIINALLGLLLGFWGLTSRRRRLAILGIVLCLIGGFLCVIQISELVSRFMESADENAI